MDDLGSILKVVDSSGNVKNSYYYDPFGNSLNKNETVSNPWQYASGYFDANTGLYKFGTRYYDPQTGRWTQKDPVGGSIGKIGSGNPYVYAGDEPNMQVDPSGRDSCFEAIKNAALGVIVADLTAIGAFIGYVYSVAQVDAAAAGLAAALEGAGDVTAASAAVGAATLGQAFAVFVLIGAAVIIFQIFSQNADAIQAACS